MTGTAVARQESRAVATGPVFALPAKQQGLLEQARSQIEPYLPRGVDFDAVISDVFLATRKNPELLSQDAESLVMAVVEVQQRGLRIGSTCHLVPKGGKVHAWNDIRGDVEMIVRSGACRDITANVVYEHEPFSLVETGTGPEMRHEIISDAASRGAIKGAYARFWLGGRRYLVKYLPLADIEAVRAGSLQWNPRKHPKCPPWYALKTVIRQGAKYLPKNQNMLPVYATFDRDAALDTVDAPVLVRAHDETIDMATGEILDEAPAQAAPTFTLEQARVHPFPFRKGTALHGRPLGEMDTENLTKVATWIVEQQDAKGDRSWHNETLLAINLVVEDREQAQGATAEPPVSEAPTAEEPPVDALPLEGEPERPAPGSLSHRVPKGGKVEDAFRNELPLGDPPKRGRNAIAEP